MNKSLTKPEYQFSPGCEEGVTPASQLVCI